MNLSRHSAPQMERKPHYRHKVASLRKNSVERIEVTLDKYNGSDLVNIAVVRDATGSHSLNGMKGTARYVTVQTGQLRDLIEALQDAERRAVAEGILPAELDA